MDKIMGSSTRCFAACEECGIQTRLVKVRYPVYAPDYSESKTFCSDNCVIKYAKKITVKK
jgi:hypothetical protein